MNVRQPRATARHRTGDVNRGPAMDRWAAFSPLLKRFLGIYLLFALTVVAYGLWAVYR
jgi:hypothetical protein